jgi:hypothetical protein
MQKVQSYLYPNRVILIANLAGFNVENTIVYAKTVKIYKGVDNVIEFDIQNADQKRLDLTAVDPIVSDILLNLMDAQGNALPNSPYTVTPKDTVKGIGTVTIPAVDVQDLNHQFLKYSVTAINNGNTIPLYNDSRFSAVGTIELVGNAVPVLRPSTIYDRFSGEINFMGNVINHTSAIPVKFYEAVKTSIITISLELTNLIGVIKFEGTTDSTISVESFKNPVVIHPNITFTRDLKGNGTITYSIPIDPLVNYFRVSWVYPDVWQYGSQQNPGPIYGTVDKVIVSF